MDKINKETIRWTKFNSFSQLSHIKQDNTRKTHSQNNVTSLFDIAFSKVAKLYTFNEINSSFGGIFDSDQRVDINEKFLKYGFSMDFSNIHKLWILNDISQRIFDEAVSFCDSQAITHLVQCGSFLMSNITHIPELIVVSINNIRIPNNQFRYKICIQIEKSRIIKWLCSCGSDNKFMCPHVIATCLAKVFSPEKAETVPHDLRELSSYANRRNMILHRRIFKEVDWIQTLEPFTEESNIFSNKIDSIEAKKKLLNSLTNKTIIETMNYFENVVRNVLKYINEFYSEFFDIPITSYPTIPFYSMRIMEEYIYKYFKMEDLTSFSCFSKDVQKFYEVLKDLVYTNEECGFYGSVYFLTQCFSIEKFPRLYLAFLLFNHVNYENLFKHDSLLTEPTYDTLVDAEFNFPQSLRANIIGFIVLDCVKNIRRFIFTKNISKDDLKTIEIVCLNLANKFQDAFGEYSTMTIRFIEKPSNLYDPISTLLFKIVKDIRIILESKTFVDETDSNKCCRNDLTNHSKTKEYNLAYGLKQIFDMNQKSFKEDCISNYYDTIPKESNFFENDMEKTIKNHISFDIPLLKDFSSLTLLRARTGQNITTIKHFIKYWLSLENKMKLFVTYDKSDNEKFHLPINYIREAYDEFYECITLIYNMAYYEANRMIYDINPSELCEILYIVMTIPRTFLYDYLQEINLMAFQSKFLNIFKILINTKSKKKETIKYFSQKIDSFVEMFNLEKLHQPGVIVNSYFIGMVSKICSDNVNDCTDFSKSFKEHVKSCYNEIMLKYLEYTPNISTKAYFNFLQIFYEDKAKFIVENIKSNCGCKKILDEMMSRIIITEYGHFYSNGKSNCFTLNEKSCKHLQTTEIKKAPTIYSTYIIKIIILLLFEKKKSNRNFNSIGFVHQSKDFKDKRSTINYISLLLATYASCINFRNQYLSKCQHFFLIDRVFCSGRHVEFLVLRILETINLKNCFPPDNMFDLTFKTANSREPYIKSRGIALTLEHFKEIYNYDIKRVKQFIYFLENRLCDKQSLIKVRQNVIIAFKNLCEKYTKTEYYKEVWDRGRTSEMITTTAGQERLRNLYLSAPHNLIHCYFYRYRNLADMTCAFNFGDTYLIIKDLYKLKNEIESPEGKYSLTCNSLDDGKTYFYRVIEDNIANYDAWSQVEQLRDEIIKTTYLLLGF